MHLHAMTMQCSKAYPNYQDHTNGLMLYLEENANLPVQAMQIAIAGHCPVMHAGVIPEADPHRRYLAKVCNSPKLMRPLHPLRLLGKAGEPTQTYMTAQ